MRPRAGFTDLAGDAVPAAPALARRSALLGAVLGALGVVLWAQQLQQAIDELQSDTAHAQAELARLQAAQAQRAEQGRQQQAAQVQFARMQAAQQARLHLLAILEDLAQAPGPRLNMLRMDAQGLRLQGQAEGAALQAWAQHRLAASAGLGPPQLTELMPTEGGQAMRFVLHWPVLPGKAVP